MGILRLYFQRKMALFRDKYPEKSHNFIFFPAHV